MSHGLPTLINKFHVIKQKLYHNCTVRELLNSQSTGRLTWRVEKKFCPYSLLKSEIIINHIFCTIIFLESNINTTPIIIPPWIFLGGRGVFSILTLIFFCGHLSSWLDSNYFFGWKSGIYSTIQGLVHQNP